MAKPVTPLGPTRFDFGPLARTYEQWYETPAGRAHDRVQQEDVRRLLPSASAGERLLDVGCGTGHWSAFFCGMGYRVAGIDIAPEMVEAARAALPECAFEVADAGALPFDDASFDVVASMATLEFVPDPAAVVGEMARCARPGGVLLVGTLNRLAPLNRDRVARGEAPYGSARLLSPDSLRRLLAPWGPVRMLASAAHDAPDAPSLAPEPGGLSGAFLVAKVQR